MLVTLFRALSHVPLPLLHALGVACGWLVYLLSPSYRRRLRENIARAGHTVATSAAIGEAGKGVFELAFVWCADPRRVLRSAVVENWSAVEEARVAGRGIIFLTPHLGCFEVIAQKIAEIMPLTVMYRPPRKAALKPLVEGARARGALKLAPASLAGVRILLKALKGGQPIGLLPDQVPQQGEGVWADFFGKPAYTMTLPAKLHQMSGAPIILAYAERKPWGQGYVVRFSRFDAVLEGSAAEQARTINQAMEALIAHCPSQYLWSYNRYKTPKGVSLPAGDA